MSDSIGRKTKSQALPDGYPNPLLVPYDGRTYKLFWHPASGRYRLRIFGYPERTYGPDPGKALMEALAEIPKLMSGQIERPKKVNRRKERPEKIHVKAFGQTWTLRYHKSGYRTNKGLASYIYAGHDPLEAPDIFKQKLLRIMHPEAVPEEEAAPPFVTLEVALDEWLETKERVSKGRYQSYKYDRNLLVDEASDAMKRLPVEEISTRQWAALQHKMLERRKSLSSRKSVCQTVQEVKQLMFDRHDLRLNNVAGYFNRNDMTEGREEIPPDLFSADEIGALLEKADRKWKAIVLWAVNGAFEPLDLASLKWSQIDLANGWFQGHRMKKKRSAPTPPMRRFKFWRETIDAMEAWKLVRTPSKLVFPKRCGTAYKTRLSNDSTFSGEFNALQEAAGIKVDGRGFYGLRHSAAHFMGKAPFLNQMGVDVVMGHTYGLDHVYDPHTDDRHVEYVCEYARRYLFEGREAADKYAGTVISDVGKTALRVVADDEPLPGKAS
jgi:integrase